MSVISMKTERLILRKLEYRDAPFYYERITSRPAVAKTMLWEPHSCVNETETVFQKILSRYEDSGYHRWAIALRNDDTVIGTAELLRFTADGCCVINCAILFICCRLCTTVNHAELLHDTAGCRVA